jgi:hypothetical protein
MKGVGIISGYDTLLRLEEKNRNINMKSKFKGHGEIIDDEGRAVRVPINHLVNNNSKNTSQKFLFQAKDINQVKQSKQIINNIQNIAEKGVLDHTPNPDDTDDPELIQESKDDYLKNLMNDENNYIDKLYKPRIINGFLWPVMN